MNVGFVGLSHLGLVTSLVTSMKVSMVVAVDEDRDLILNLSQGVTRINEPGLSSLLKNQSSRISFTNDFTKLNLCEIVYISLDIPTDSSGSSNLNSILNLIDKVAKNLSQSATVVILSQVPPGFTRKIAIKYQFKIVYQVETLIFGRAIERAMYPERFIIGVGSSKSEVSKELLDLLETFECPILKTDYETAELTKLTINLFLAGSVTLTNTIAQVCERLGADWSTIADALRLDRRIGKNAYLSPGLGLSGGNIERDLINLISISNTLQVDSILFQSMLSNSEKRKLWPAEILQRVLPPSNPKSQVAVWGLAYKVDTESTRNSASIENLKVIVRDYRVKVSDPIAILPEEYHDIVEFTSDPLETLVGSEALLIMTKWPIYESIVKELDQNKLNAIVIIDPYGVSSDLLHDHPRYFTLGQGFRWRGAYLE